MQPLPHFPRHNLQEAVTILRSRPGRDGLAGRRPVGDVQSKRFRDVELTPRCRVARSRVAGASLRLGVQRRDSGCAASGARAWQHCGTGLAFYVQSPVARTKLGTRVDGPTSQAKLAM